MTVNRYNILKSDNSLRKQSIIKRETNWYIFYTSPRSEKVVYKELSKRDYEVFLPMTRTLRIWKNRQKKWIDQVLFPNYVFVNTYQHKLYGIKSLPKISTYIHCAGKPSVISSKDIDGIKKMLNLDQEVSVETSFCEGEKVRILSGPLIGFEGVLVNRRGKSRFGIQLKEINQTVFIDICTNQLEKI